MPDVRRKARKFWESRKRAEIRKNFRAAFPGSPFCVQVRDQTGTLICSANAARVEIGEFGQLVVHADPHTSALYAQH